jgi:hypothetical protein
MVNITMKRPWPLIPVLLLCTTFSVAQIPLDAWIGTWDLDVDGLPHQLFVINSNRTCNSTPWCAIDLAYRDSNGENHPARIITMNNPDSLTFEVLWSGNVTLHFDAYRFTRDRNRLAGITKKGGAVRGFSGTRR